MCVCCLFVVCGVFFPFLCVYVCDCVVLGALLCYALCARVVCHVVCFFVYIDACFVCLVLVFVSGFVLPPFFLGGGGRSCAG